MDSPSSNFITKASLYYCDKFPLRAVIQAIPALGGSLDTMLAGLGAKYQYDRLEKFIAHLNHKIANLQKNCVINDIKPSEELFDFVIQAFENVIKTRSEEKSKRLANIVANQIANPIEWDEAETACRLLNELTDNHIHVLMFSINANESASFGQRGRLLRISRKDKGASIFEEDSLYLNECMPNISDMALRLICTELVSNCLLKDVGIGWGNTVPLTLLSPTELADWFIKWIDS